MRAALPAGLSVTRLAPGWWALIALGAALWTPALWALIPIWAAEPSLSHGPLILAVALYLLWCRRDEVRKWSPDAPWGAWPLGLAGILHVAANWADVEFVRTASLILMTIAGFYYLGGGAALRTTVGPLGFLIFMAPWPTTVVETLSFPLQMTSAAYAALLCGLMGLPIHRQGVHLSVLAPNDEQPVYSILVARECSGLTSMLVLLAVAYLIAYHTAVGLPWRALMLATVVPLALLSNAVRLSLVLLAGAKQNADIAKWVHDHEAPVLVFLCSLGLLALRHALVTWTQTNDQARAWHYGRVPAFYR